MQLAFAFLAEFADHTSEGKLLALGIDFDRLVTDTLPARLQCAVVSKLRASAEEAAESHPLTLELVDPAGESHFIKSDLPTSFPHPAAGRDSSGLAVGVKVNTVLQHAGRYEFRVIVGGQEMCRLPLDVALTSGR